jgi:hypothetical protein
MIILALLLLLRLLTMIYSSIRASVVFTEAKTSVVFAEATTALTVKI